ncbi:MAG TPA: hypothetical protein VK158_04020 [Acidobacteriota bacterium]|nr:hypothetical protein [Acidobacteriota bacterium]
MTIEYFVSRMFLPAASFEKVVKYHRENYQTSNEALFITGHYASNVEDTFVEWLRAHSIMVPSSVDFGLQFDNRYNLFYGISSVRQKPHQEKLEQLFKLDIDFTDAYYRYVQVQVSPSFLNASADLTAQLATHYLHRTDTIPETVIDSLRQVNSTFL